LHPLGAHHRECDVVLDPGGLLGSGEVARGFFEEIEHGGIFERGRVGNVDHHVGALQGSLQAFPGHRVDPRFRRGGQDIMPILAQPFAELGADQPGSADHDNFHDVCLRLLGVRELGGDGLTFKSRRG
jgi:hypothetical protein